MNSNCVGGSLWAPWTSSRTLRSLCLQFDLTSGSSTNRSDMASLACQILFLSKIQHGVRCALSFKPVKVIPSGDAPSFNLLQMSSNNWIAPLSTISRSCAGQTPPTGLQSSEHNRTGHYDDFLSLLVRSSQHWLLKCGCTVVQAMSATIMTFTLDVRHAPCRNTDEKLALL